MSLQNVFDAFSGAMRSQRSDYHLTLGQAIDILTKYNGAAIIRLEDGKGLGRPHSFRGYYSDLALEPKDTPGTVAELLSDLTAVHNRELTGYKGGEYLMDSDTPLWVAFYGTSSDIAITGLDLADAGERIVVLTRNTEKKEG